MTAQIFTVVCAWCHRTIKQASADASVTHTICPPCVERTMARRCEPQVLPDTDSDLGQLIPPPGYFGDVH